MGVKRPLTHAIGHKTMVYGSSSNKLNQPSPDCRSEQFCQPGRHKFGRKKTVLKIQRKRPQFVFGNKSTSSGSGNLDEKRVLKIEDVRCVQKRVIGNKQVYLVLISRSFWVQRLINLEIQIIVRSLKSSNVELGQYLDRIPLFKCCLSAAANP